MLNINNLSVAFKNILNKNIEEKHVVRNVSFSLAKGETVALVGESGSGKSLTALSILGLLNYPAAFHPNGSVTLDGKELLNLPERELMAIRGHRIGMIFQEPMTALNPLHTILQQISEPLFLHFNMNKKDALAKVLDLLQLVGFEDAAERLNAYPHQLSGGQRQRVMIAMALACEPDILIADEPTTALDVTLQATILDLIKSLQKRFQMGLLLITHDLGVVSKMADKMVVMKHGEVVEKGFTNVLIQNPAHPYTKHLIESEPSGAPAPVPLQSDNVLSTKSLKVSFDKPVPLLTKIFQINQKPDFIAVNDISFTLKQGETIGIVGESGSGKSTLAYALLRLVKSQGEIFLDEKRIDQSSMKDLRPLRSSFQIIFQDPFSSLNPRFSIEQLIAEGLVVHQPGITAIEREQIVSDILKEVGLDPEARHRYPHEFSGGQRQRIAIARALILKPRILVLDEPTSALDRSIQIEIMDLLRKLQEKHGLSYLFISHDLKVVRAMSHRIIVMRYGKVVEEGSVGTIFNNPQELYTKELLKAAFSLNA
ncbi:MAG: ABC transporter ATP-binding protein [Candidatus Paracaedibacteraceae bacterium]|nr:ABC transporter ATP-binding protein [Candidatus Paracaedibacteraceae bacterium]